MIFNKKEVSEVKEEKTKNFNEITFKESPEENKNGLGNKIYRMFQKARKTMINFILGTITLLCIMFVPNGIYVGIFTLLFYIVINYLLSKIIPRKLMMKVDLSNHTFQLMEMTQSTLSEYSIVDRTGAKSSFKHSLKAGKDDVSIYDYIDEDNRKIYANPVFCDLEALRNVEEFITNVKDKSIAYYRENATLRNLKDYQAVEEAFEMTMKNPLLDLFYHGEDNEKKEKEIEINANTKPDAGQSPSKET